MQHHEHTVNESYCYTCQRWLDNSDPCFMHSHFEPAPDVEEDDDRENCPDCGGSGRRSIPLYDDWGDVEGWTERTCSFCGGVGNFDATQAAEMKAEMGRAYYDEGGY